jgi:hypothetical protein
MGIDLKSIENASELHQVLTGNLPLGVATSPDAQNFLNKHQMNGSSIEDK